MNRENVQLTPRQISAEWQRILEQRGMMMYGACASIERGNGGSRKLVLRNGQKVNEVPITLMQLEMPLDQFTASILAPAIGGLA